MMKTKILCKMSLVLALATAMLMSCDDKKDGLTLNDIKDADARRFADSLALRDSLKLQYYRDSVDLASELALKNAAGQVNYTISVVNGSSSAFFRQARTSRTQNLDGATVTVSQFGKLISKTTDPSGMVSFSGFLRGAISVSIMKEGFTTLNYTAHVPSSVLTPTGTKTELANMVPIFELEGSNTATLSGRATIETDLTNKVAEVVPEGTTVTAAIDASHAGFAGKFFSKDVIADDANPYTANIYNAVYDTNIIGSTNAEGEYSITIPAAVDGLPIKFEYSQIAATQKLFQSSDLGINNVVNFRTLFGPSITPTPIPPAGGVAVTISTGAGASATATITEDGKVERINIISGGRGYGNNPDIIITPPPIGGVPAKATATVSNGVITGITLVDPGAGYTSAPMVTVNVGTGAFATATITPTTSVLAVTITNSGSGYASAPAVTFAASPTGETATGIANIKDGRVTSITITNGGAGYDPAAMPAITIDPPAAGGTQALAFAHSAGHSINDVSIISNGTDYPYAPAVVFDLPQLPSGVRAEGVAIYDANIRGVVGVEITNPGSGYLVAPGVTFDAGSGADLEAQFAGRGVQSVRIDDGGEKYTSAPTVVFTSPTGSGATGNAIVANGKVIAIEITNPGSGYETPPGVSFVSGADAEAYAVVDNGAVVEIKLVDGGYGYTGAPEVILTPIGGSGSGATANATIANGVVTSITVTNGGGGYIGGNIPAMNVPFGGPYVNDSVKPGITYVHDLYYGTGAKQN